VREVALDAKQDKEISAAVGRAAARREPLLSAIFEAAGKDAKAGRAPISSVDLPGAKEAQPRVHRPQRSRGS